MRKTIRFSIPILAIVLCSLSPLLPNETLEVPLLNPKYYKEIHFPGYENWNAIWDLHASGPYIYVPLCAESPFTESVRLFRYDTRSGQKRMILNADEAAGIDLSTGVMPQSKFHTAIRTMKDGRLFMVSHNTAAGRFHPNWAIFNLWHDPTGFSSRAFIYDPFKETVTYLGTPVPNEDLYYGQIDQELNLYYACGMRKRTLYVISLDDFTVTELGNHPCWMAIVVDDDHLVYTCDERMRIWKWDPIKKKSEMTGLRMPHSPHLTEPRAQLDFWDWLHEHFTSPTANLKESYGFWVYGWKDDGWIYGAQYFANRLCRFRPHEGIMEDLGDFWEEYPEKPGLIKMYAPVKALNGKVYYGYLNDKKSSEGTQIIEFDPITKKKKNLGTMQLGDGTCASALGEGVLGADGKIYWGNTNHPTRGAMLWAFDPAMVTDDYRPEKTVRIRDREELSSKAMPIPRYEDTAAAGSKKRLWRLEPLPGKFKEMKFEMGYRFTQGKIESISLEGKVYPLFDSAVYGMTASPDGWIYGVAGGEKSYLFRLSEKDLGIENLGIIPSKKKAINGHIIIAGKNGVFFAGDGIYRWTKEKGMETLRSMPEEERPVALAFDRKSPYLYVLTEPANRLLLINIENGELAGKYQLEGYVQSRWLGAAKDGGVYGFENDGRIYKVDSHKNMKRLAAQVPSLKGLGFMAEVTSLSTAKNGTIWGGTREGYLFSINTENDAVFNYGKPGTYYLKGVMALSDGVYSFGGGDFGDTHMYRYTEGQGFEDLGLVTSNPVHEAVQGEDSKLYAGEYSSAASIIRISVE